MTDRPALSLVCLVRWDGPDRPSYVSSQASAGNVFLTSDPAGARTFHSVPEAEAWVAAMLDTAAASDRRRIERLESLAAQASLKARRGGPKASTPRPPPSLRDVVARALDGFGLARLIVTPPDRRSPVRPLAIGG